LFYVILPHQQGFVIRHPHGKELYKAKPAADQFHYISWEAFDKLKPVDSSAFLQSGRQIDMDDLIADVCSELDVIDDRIHSEQGKAVNSHAKDYISPEIVRLIRENHVRFGHQSPSDLAMMIARNARADIPKYTPQQVLKVMERWPCIYCKVASARIGSRGRGSGVKIEVVAYRFSVDNKDGFEACLHFHFTGYYLLLLTSDLLNDWSPDNSVLFDELPFLSIE